MCRLLPILEELWLRIRDLCFIRDPGPPSLPSEPSTPVADVKGRGKQREVVTAEVAAAAATLVALSRAASPPGPAVFDPARYPKPFTTPAPSDVEQDSEEEDIAVAFLNKVRIEKHGLPGNVKSRRK